MISVFICVLAPISEVQESPGFWLTGEMAEKGTGSFHNPSQILLDQQRRMTQANISLAFPRFHLS